ncbi:MAG: hypothetical protein AABX47_10100 [Nanoarchaeota archaeon]
MAVISIVGTSGVGKSFLVKQLASMECLPAFFEGEEGTIPGEIFEDVFTKGDPLNRGRWFLAKYKLMLERARRISNSGIDCYLDVAAISPKAIIVDEDKTHDSLMKMIEEASLIQSDKVVLLTANKESLKNMIARRARESEDTPNALARAIRVQNEFIRLSEKDKNTITIDRSNLDFSKEADLRSVLARIRD